MLHALSLLSLLAVQAPSHATGRPPAPTLAFDAAGVVLGPGPAGSWDSFATYSPYVVRHADRYLLFYTGFAARDYSDGALGLATSPDGVHWTKVGAGPVVRGTGEVTRVQCAVVGEAGDGSWFLLANGSRRGEVCGGETYLWRAPEPSGPWVAHGEAVLAAGPQTWWASNAPTGLIERDGEWMLSFAGWNESAPRLGLARSRDLEHWELVDDPTTDDPARRGADPLLAGGAGAWEQAGVALYTPFATARGLEAFYVGFPVNPLPTYRIAGTFRIGHATSADGQRWRRTSEAPLLDTGEHFWPALATLVVGERCLVYYDLEGGQRGIGLLSGQLPASAESEAGTAASPVVHATRALYDRHRESGQGAASRAALFEFWAEHDAAHAGDSAYLLAKAELLGWLDEDEEATRIFARVPDADLVQPIHLFNRLQHRAETELALVIPLLQRLASVDERRAARWVHECYAQRLAPGPKDGLDVAPHLALLEALAGTGSPAARVVSGLSDWVGALAAEGDMQKLQGLLAREPDSGLDEALTYGERYRLLLATHARRDPALAPLAEQALRASAQRLQRRVAATEGEHERAQRARARYQLAHAAWLLAHPEHPATQAERLEWLLLAARGGPDSGDRDLGSAWFYEMVCLGGLPEFRSAVASELEQLGEVGLALEVWLELALVQPERRAEARAAFRRLAPGEEFEARWLDVLERRLPVAPELRLATPSGETRSLAELRGRWVLLDFWGTWCGPCRAELPRIEALHRDLLAAPAPRAALLTVACNDSAEVVARFLVEHGHTFPVVVGDPAVQRAFGITSFPTKLLVTPGGRMLTLPDAPGAWETIAREHMLSAPEAREP